MANATQVVKAIKFMDKAGIEKAIESVHNRGKKLDGDIQGAGLSILNHIQQYGEVSLAIKLFQALPKGSRRNALADWFMKFGKVTLNTDKASSKEFPFVFFKGGETDLEGAAAMAWYDCKPEKELLVEFDVQAKVMNLIAQVRKAVSSGIDLKGDTRMIQALLELEGVAAKPAAEVEQA